jgi:hypothetical protein
MRAIDTPLGLALFISLCVVVLGTYGHLAWLAMKYIDGGKKKRHKKHAKTF